MKLCLVVDDSEVIRKVAHRVLEECGWTVIEAETADEGLVLVQQRMPEAILLDALMPGMPPAEFCAELRRLPSGSAPRVIYCTTEIDAVDILNMLNAGADDYLIKPFGVAELHARLRVALRHASRSTLAGESSLRLGDVRIDLAAKTVQRGDVAVRLTATQWRLLEVLAQHAGRVVTARQLLREVWGPGHSEQGHYLRIYVRQLRQKLERVPAQPAYLLTDTGIGYRLLVDVPQALDAG